MKWQYYKRSNTFTVWINMDFLTVEVRESYPVADETLCLIKTELTLVKVGWIVYCSRLRIPSLSVKLRKVTENRLSNNVCPFTH